MKTIQSYSHIHPSQWSGAYEVKWKRETSPKDIKFVVLIVRRLPSSTGLFFDNLDLVPRSILSVQMHASEVKWKTQRRETSFSFLLGLMFWLLVGFLPTGLRQCPAVNMRCSCFATTNISATLISKSEDKKAEGILNWTLYGGGRNEVKKWETKPQRGTGIVYQDAFLGNIQRSKKVKRPTMEPDEVEIASNSVSFGNQI